MTFYSCIRVCLLFGSLAVTQSLPATANSSQPWMNSTISPDERASLLVKQMTPAEMVQITHGYAALARGGSALPPGAIGSAGYVPGIPRLGIPALQETDAGLGVANPANVRPGDIATALPSGLATAASFDPLIAYAGGAMIGSEAKNKGFNVLLAGGVNLARDPRNGRNFEYLGEDPLLAGTLDGEIIRGIQDQHIVSTVKHYVINDQETNRHWANAIISDSALRESDLLAFELAIEKGRPGSVMCSYNLIGGAYGCGNNHLLTEVLKGDWHYPGWVMSDWGAVYSTDFARAGLDQESAAEFDKEPYFGSSLEGAVKDGTIPQSRLMDMAHRILRSMFAAGLFEHPSALSAINYDSDADVAQHTEEAGIVLLKNDRNILPLTQSVKRIAVIGSHADAGVLSGSGSSQVTPVGQPAVIIPVGGDRRLPTRMRDMIFDPSSPLDAIRAKAGNSEVRFDNGRYPSSAARLAKWADVVIVFANQWMTEGADAPDITLPDGQDSLIAAAAQANPNTIVVLQTGGPIAMPWLDNVGAIVEAWYPGQRGGAAIANILFGTVNPSGHLPITFPMAIGQNPRPELPGADLGDHVQFDVNYSEGSDVGYRWFARNNMKALFPFGFGLSYTTFEYSNLKITGGKTMSVSFDVTNTGTVSGADAPQIYLTSQRGTVLERLIGFSKVYLQPGHSQQVSVTADVRLLANFDGATHKWRIPAGLYNVAIGRSAEEGMLAGSAKITGQYLLP